MGASIYLQMFIVQRHITNLVLQLFYALLQLSSRFGRIGKIQVCVIDLPSKIIVFLSQTSLDVLAVYQEVL